jgi:hypothetical protein
LRRAAMALPRTMISWPALWAVSRYAETGTPAAMLESLPLFAAANSSPLPDEADIKLPAMALGEHVLADYLAIRMSLKTHPMAPLRADFDKRNYLPTVRLRILPSGRPGEGRGHRAHPANAGHGFRRHLLDAGR